MMKRRMMKMRMMRVLDLGDLSVNVCSHDRRRPADVGFHQDNHYQSPRDRHSPLYLRSNTYVPTTHESDEFALLG